ncbi:sulfotransferase family protein [Mycobacterium sp. M23085]|uniref:sulfotransferase family protein n=1 Tax=Mycobacterium sp. M23085 TaxID=3378087 RepID=UPI00387840A1
MTTPERMGRERPPVALFVLGMGRSGTSALTRLLSLCGAALPPGMLGADATNPRGYWEPRESLLLNGAILYRHGSAWFDPTLRVLEDGRFDAQEKAVCMAEINAFLQKIPAAPLVVIKDLNIVVLSGMWFEAARQAGFDVATVIAVRHPQEVIASLARAMRSSPELAAALWLKGNLLAERHTRGVPRVFVDYANLLEDWRREVARISEGLAIDLSARDDTVIDEFLRPDLHRQRHGGQVTDPFGGDWVWTAYNTLRAAARDEPCDESVLDRIFAQYRASEYGFRTALDDFRSNYNSPSFRLLRPAIMKPILEVVAMAHRRRGTWA